MSTTHKIFISFLGLSLLVAGCSGGEEPAKEKVEFSAEKPAERISTEDDFMLPQPISLAHAFKNAGLSYTPGKTNPPSNKDTYAKKIDQLLNLGVYSTDLAYCAINNKTQEAREYLGAIQSLGSKVGLESVFSDKAMIDKFDKNLGNQEALEELIYELQDKSDAYMDDNDLKSLAAIEFAGAWVEGMYLGVEDSKKNQSGIGVALVDQMSLLKNTIKGLENNSSDDARFKEILSQFKGVLATYEGFASVEKAAKNANFKVPELTSSEFDKLVVKIKLLRNNIVSPSQK